MILICTKRENTAKVFKNLTIKRLFGKPGKGGLKFSRILNDAIDSDFPEDTILGARLRRMCNSVEERDRSQPTPICYRDFFVTTGATTFEQVLAKLVDDPDVLIYLKADFDVVKTDFQLPMMELPGGHKPMACKNLIDGWSEPPDPDPSVEPEIAGLVHTFGDETLTSILSEKPDYTNPDVPWRWRAHLLRFANLFGLTSMSGGADTHYEAHYKSHLARMAGGANQCAYYTGTSWGCQSDSGSKCTLVEGEPTEGTDLCSPPPGP